jgi:hypothetical protein
MVARRPVFVTALFVACALFVLWHVWPAGPSRPAAVVTAPNCQTFVPTDGEADRPPHGRIHRVTLLGHTFEVADALTVKSIPLIEREINEDHYQLRTMASDLSSRTDPFVILDVGGNIGRQHLVCVILSGHHRHDVPRHVPPLPVGSHLYL